MRWLRNLAINLASKLPSVKNLLTRATRAIEEASLIKQASQVENLMGQEIELQFSRLRERMEDMLDLRRAQLACSNPAAFLELRESHAGPVESVGQFKERLWDLELALEDRGWVREIALSNLEFSCLGVQQLIRIIRIYAIKNPIIKRGAEICALYVFGRGVEIRSEDDGEDLIIQEFLERNKREFSHIALARKEHDFQTDGSQYWALPADARGKVKAMMIEPLEILDIVTDPDDTSVPWFFKRQWQRWDGITTTAPENKTAWYPTLDYVMYGPPAKPAQIQNVPVVWEMPVVRVKGGCPAKWRWGVPLLYAAVDWARCYREFLEDWATVQRTLSRFALMIETKGGAGAIAAYNALLNTTFADNQGTQIEHNPPPVTGSAHISGPGNTVKPFNSAGAKDSPEQSRRLLLMAAAAIGLPETFFGDASTGSLATAQSLDRPTELKFREIQQRWIEVLTMILRYVLLVSRQSPGSQLREAAADSITKPDKIQVKFPSVLEHDIGAMVDAWIKIVTMGGRNGIPAGILDRKTFLAGALSEIGYQDVNALLDAIFGEDYDPGEDVEDQRTVPAPQSITAPVKPTDPNNPTAKPSGKKGAVERAKVNFAEKQARSKKFREAVEAGATEKQWVGGTCDVCLDNSGAGWIAEDELFPSGDDEPPAHNNCTCDLETRDAED